MPPQGGSTSVSILGVIPFHWPWPHFTAGGGRIWPSGVLMEREDTWAQGTYCYYGRILISRMWHTDVFCTKQVVVSSCLAVHHT